MAYVLNVAPGRYLVTGQSVSLVWSGAGASTYPQTIAVAVMGV